MGKGVEVLPDSQDEAELDTSDLLGLEFSPLRERNPPKNASIPSLGASPPFELPRPMPANGTATSTISQYTADTVLKTVSDGTSFISAFTTSSSRRPPSKPRPKPKPNYAGAAEADDLAIHGHVRQISSIEFPSGTGKIQPLPLPECTFTADISERIKARRALAKQTDTTVGKKLLCGVKKPALAVEAVIDISSDDDIPSGASHLPTSSKDFGKLSGKSQSIPSLGSGAPALGQSSLCDKVEAGQSASPRVSRKRKRDSALGRNATTPPAPAAADETNNRLGSGDGQDAGPPSKQTKKKVTNTTAPQRIDSSYKLFYTHPPKNRPLSAILQVVNGSSPRRRASPSISRNLLTRIVPLHPNRRTPPPPPPPRIIPKKTKKELEREEKWEEELQDTVQGWCELEELERERLRREKRDWELGFYEE